MVKALLERVEDKALDALVYLKVIPPEMNKEFKVALLAVVPVPKSKGSTEELTEVFPDAVLEKLKL